MPFSYQEAGELYNTTETVLSKGGRVAQATKTLADIGAIDPSNVRGYLFVVIKDAAEDGTVECTVYNAGTGSDKAVMLEALADTLAKQQARRERQGPQAPSSGVAQ